MKIDSTPLFIIIAFFLLACDEDTNDPLTGDFEPGKGIFLLCEGQFQQGNASVDYLNTEARVLRSSVYEQENARPVGDVLQSMLVDGQTGYLVVNNSGTVVRTDLSDMSWTGEVSGLTSPRYLLKVSDEKAYVSDLFAGEIAVLDLNAMSATASIEAPGWTEQMVMANGMVYVANVNTHHIIIIDPAADEVVDSIAVGDGPSALELDADGDLWVLSIGDFATGSEGSLNEVDLVTNQLIRTIPLGPNSGVGPRLEMTPGRDTLLYLYQDLYKMPIDAAVAPAQPFIGSNGRSLYGLGVDPQNGDIFLSDAGNFNQRSTVFVYTRGGAESYQLMSGFNCNGFVPY